MTEGEMVGWDHRLNGHEFEQAPGDGKGQGTLACHSPWGCKELDTTERLNNNRHSLNVVNSSLYSQTILFIYHQKLERQAYIKARLLQFSLVQFSCSVMSDSLQLHGLQHASIPCSAPSSGAFLNSCPVSW